MGDVIDLLLTVALIASWFQHLYTSFTEEAWGFLIAGAIFFPIAWVHGIGVWFGLW
jgi:hypothetical protein